ELAALAVVVQVLAGQGIKIRGDDGALRQINQSVPTVRPDVFVVGLRSEKRDGSHTEDHFVFDKARPSVIGKCYGKRLDEIFAEYRGAHKPEERLRCPTAGRRDADQHRQLQRSGQQVALTVTPDVPENVPAARQNQAKTTPPDTRPKRKTARQLQKLP